MSRHLISRRYAQALMNLAEKDKQVDAVAEGLDDLADAMKVSPQLSSMISDPKVPHEEKKKVIEALLEKAKVPALVNNFVRLIVSKRRLGLLVDMRDQFHVLADERLGRGKAEVIVASELSDKQQDALKKKLEKLSSKQLDLQVKIDPTILGGVVARIGSTVWDGSLRSQLNQIRESIIEG